MTTLLASLSKGAPLVAAWAVTAFAVTLLLTVMAVLMHRVARGSVAHRWVWGGALLVAFVFTATQPWRRAAAPVAMTLPVATTSPAPSLQAAQPSAWDAGLATMAAAVRVADEALTQTTSASAAAVRSLPRTAQLCIVLLWPMLSATLIAIGVWSYRRQRCVLRHAAQVEAQGHTLFVSEGTGPAVFGILRPRIVVPGWLMLRTPDEQRLVVAHEASHIAAGDPALLLTACALTALMPWNPCAWYMLARLRLAIELDCDARVLQSGATPRHYGALLIDLSATATPAPLLTGAAAFSHHASHLERRLRFMTDRPVTHTTARRLASLSIGTLAIIAACGAELPTSAELKGMDVAAAEKRAFVVAPNMTAASYTVDGKAVSEQEAKALSADRIASIEIQKQDKKRSLVRIKTQQASATVSVAADSAAPLKRTLVAVRADGTADSSRTLLIGDSIRYTTAKREAPLVFVDGVKATEGALKTMSPDRIERIEVIKGAAAEKLYGPEGAKGAIVVTTKKN